VVGNFGSQRRSDYTAIGTTVNLAARLESVCEAGEALVSVDIANFLPEEAFTRAGEFKLKGFGEMVPAFRLKTSEKPLSTT
jgi:adenylate cyclase